MLCCVNVQAASLPDLGSPDLKDYDTKTEINLGKAFLTSLHQHHNLVQDPIILSYIRRIGKHILAEAGIVRHFSFQVINNHEINAFAGPNGIIGIHTGLINAASSEDELAAVIAHEIAHVTQRHLSRRYEFRQEIGLASVATIIAAILIGTQDPAAGFAAYMGGMSLSIQEQLKNSRAHEKEADHIGIKFLHQAGYNPDAMANFFERIQKEQQIFEHKPPEILLTHPVTQSRIARAKDRAKQMNSPLNYFNDANLRLIQLRLAVLNNNYQYPQQLTIDEQCYLSGLKGELNYNCLQTAIINHPKERLYKIQQARLLTQKNPDQGLKKFEYLINIYPKDFSILYLYAIYLEQNNQAQKAITKLTKLTPNFFYQFKLYSRLARIYANKKAMSKSYYYQALASFSIGNIKKSIHLVKQAKRIETNTNSNFYIKLQSLSEQLTQ